MTTSFKTDFKMKNLIGSGSGETVPDLLQGQGWVLVQPSEGMVKGAVGATGAQATSSNPLGSLPGRGARGGGRRLSLRRPAFLRCLALSWVCDGFRLSQMCTAEIV